MCIKNMLYKSTLIIIIIVLYICVKINVVEAASSVNWTKDSRYKLQKIDIEQIASYKRGASIENFSGQGACLVGNRLLFTTTKKGDSRTIIYSFNIDKPESSPKKLVDRNLGHANDLCYNKSSNELYVLHNGYPVYVFSVKGDGINSDISLTYKTSVRSNSRISGMARDSNKQILYGQDFSGYFVKFASNIASKITQIVKPYIEGKLTTQGMAYYNNYLYSVYSELGREGANDGLQSQYYEAEVGSTLIAKYSTGKTFEKNIYVPVKALGANVTWAEMEDIDFRSDGTMVMVYNVTMRGPVRYIKVYKVKSGVQKIDGNTYYVGKSGDYESGLKYFGNDIYYFGSNYKPVTGWQTINGNRYYFEADYKAKRGVKSINGVTYYFNNSGIMQRNVAYENYWFSSDGKGIKDTSNPQISVNWDQTPTNKKVVITVTATDKETGISSLKIDGKSVDIRQDGIYKFYAEKNGRHTVIAKDLLGHVTSKDFTINNISTSAPTISVVENNKVYYKKITPKIESKNGIKEIILTKNGTRLTGYKNGGEITGAGEYKITVIDTAGNSTTVQFSLYEADFGKYLEQKISDNNFYLRRVEAGTKVSEIIKCLKNVNSYSIMRNGKAIYTDKNRNDQILATGDILVFENLRYTIIISGDVTGDGKINNSDALAILRHIYATDNNKQQKWKLTGDKFLAGDINQKNKINHAVVIGILRYDAAHNSESIASKHKDWLTLK